MSPTVESQVIAAPGTQQPDPAEAITGLREVDMEALSVDIADDHVAGAGDAQQAEQLREVVAYADAKGYDVSFVVVDTVQPRFTIYRDIATQLQSEVGGTVIVLGPNSVGSSSPDFSRVVQEQATDNLTLQDPPAAARQMIDSMTGPNLDWTVITLILIIVVVVGAVLARMRQLRRRASAAGSPGSV